MESSDLPGEAAHLLIEELLNPLPLLAQAFSSVFFFFKAIELFYQMTTFTKVQYVKSLNTVGALAGWAGSFLLTSSVLHPTAPEGISAEILLLCKALHLYLGRL